MLCAAFGEVAKIAMFEKASGLQALVQFKDAKHAKEAQQVWHIAPAVVAAAGAAHCDSSSSCSSRCDTLWQQGLHPHSSCYV
jgi:hypothetical protein